MSFAVLGKNRRTILLVDQDPHYRAGLRLALEEAGFTVGEAANSKEGERTALRIRPDAILLAMILEGVDSGSLLAQRLREMGEKFPVYLITDAASSLDFHGEWNHPSIAGVFGKPLNLPDLIRTLKRRLGLS